MAISIWEISLTDAPLEWPDVLPDVEAGAVVDFWGVVRELEDGRQIEGIRYEVHWAMAEYQMKALAEKAAQDFLLRRLLLKHRIGFVRAGEASLFLRVAGSHRSAAFAASQWLIAELKRKVPIWKMPVFEDTNGSPAQIAPNELKEAARLA